MQLLRFFVGSPRPAVAAGMLAAALAGVTLANAPAQARPNTRNMTCASAAALVQSRGAIVLSTGANTFDRYVSNIRYCSGAEQLQPEWVRTSDSNQCFVGYTCFVPDRNDWTR